MCREEVKKECVMIQVTERAAVEMESFFERNGAFTKSVRVYIQQGISDGPSLELALDEPTETDSVFRCGGVRYVVDSELMESVGDITIDFMSTEWEFGFNVKSSNPLFVFWLGGGRRSNGGVGPFHLN